MSTRNRATVVVINKAGKVGKSTLSKHLISPMLGADLIQVETFNDTGHGAQIKVAGRNFEHIAAEVIEGTKNMCIDVGNSNYQTVMKEMQENVDFARRIHFWVIPCRDSAGVINDSLSTVQDLLSRLEVDPARIVILANDIEEPEAGLENFNTVRAAAKHFGFHFCETAIPQNPKFDVFNARPESVMRIAEDDTDYDAKIAVESDGLAREELTRAVLLRGRAQWIASRLRLVWNKSPLVSLTAA